MHRLALLLALACATARPDYDAYVDSGRYADEVAAVAAKAQAWLAVHPPGRLALVVDVDDTALSSLAALRANRFATVREGACDQLPRGPCNVLEYLKAGTMPPLPPVVALVRFAKERGIAVFFITGRAERLRAITERNLREAGYAWDGIFFKPDPSRTNADFKTEQRRRLEEQGYLIAANIGDQLSDLEGGHAERAFKVPNPFYVLP
jgi:predicted secreted acid phosphatase